MKSYLQADELGVKFADRWLFRGLNLRLDQEKVALIGRNGVGKSTLLQTLAGQARPTEGRVVGYGPLAFVSQDLHFCPRSPGEERRALLERSMSTGNGILLWDEPSSDLDEGSVQWLTQAIDRWSGGAIVASHDTRILQRFRHFFVVAESGCRYLEGELATVEEALQEHHVEQQDRYLSKLSQLEKAEERALHLARRRARKRRYGRISELDRCTPKALLNTKRSRAQESHGRIDGRRDQKRERMREFTRNARRALRVDLPFALALPDLGPASGEVLVEARELTVRRDEGNIVTDLNLSLARHRVALVGPNGSGKTTLLQTLLGERTPAGGSVTCRRERIGVIAQGAQNWMLADSLLDLLCAGPNDVEAAQRLVAQRFPLALADRPLAGLSAGERVRAALISLLGQARPPELLVLDEPTDNLDILGQKALLEVLSSWPGGLLVASHRPDFLEGLGVNQWVRLG